MQNTNSRDLRSISGLCVPYLETTYEPFPQAYAPRIDTTVYAIHHVSPRKH